MSTGQKVRDFVKQAYTRAALRIVGKGCCGGAAPKGAIVKLAGYGREDLAELPPEAVVNSFGCGNPLAFGEVEEGQVVLDLGSGAGIDLLIAAKKVGPAGRVIGVDMTDAMIERARANAASAGLENVEVRKGIIEELPVESESVDWVISNCVINLSPEKPKVFAEIARVLKPGGRMLVSDVVAHDLPGWVYENEVLYSSCVAGAVTEEEYLDGLRQAGLADVEVRDRLVYDGAQLKGLIDTDLADADAALARWVASLSKGVIQEMAESVAGKVWSLLVYARKPAA
jgi:arsenite methyltransferase